MRKAFLATGLFIVLFAATSFGLSAQQPDLMQMARDLAAKDAADRAAAHAFAAAHGLPVKWTDADGSYFELQKIVGGIPRYYSTFNANAAISTRADSVNAIIGGGSGFVLRLWDGGKPRTTHREFGGRITWADANPSTVAGHATHTAGTMIASGVRPEAKGMSYAATIRAFEWNNDASEMASEAAGGANLSNHSYGNVRGWYYDSGSSYWYWWGDTAVSQTEDYSFGFYDSWAQTYDQIVVSAPNYLPVVSAANDRDDAGPAPGTKHYYFDSRFGTWRFSTKTRNPDGTPLNYDCLPDGFQISKNTLTIGAVYDVPSYTGPASVVLAPFSSTGPCDDGRIKPDIVGNGMELLSSYSSNDSSYAAGSGTSMSSPNVCGSLGLLADYYKDTHGGTALWASTLKGLAIHTALEAGDNPGPDYQFGWGLLNTIAAYRLLNEDYLNNAKGFVEELTLSNGQTIEYWYRVPEGTPELRATICWTDPAGTPPSAAIDPSTRMLVNDLDLRIARAVDTHYPWRLDRLNPSNAATKSDNNFDNVEQVAVTSPAAGVYAVRITHKGALGVAQKVSLIVSGGERNHVWHVYEDGSGDAPTIAAAANAAVDGDSIYVHQGTYYEAGISLAKAVVIIGVDGAALTIMDGNGLGANGFTFPAASKVILLRGLTIKNCSSVLLGGGISCSNSSVTVDHCVIENCYSPYYGGGIAVINASPAVMNCVFLGNSAAYDGGGIYLSSSTSVFDSCVVHGNTAVGAGGGIGLINAAPQFRNCTVNANAAGTNGGGVFIGTSGNPTLTRCLVTSNTSGGIYGATGVAASITCCDVYGNGVNYGGSIADRTGIDDNISEDPLYCGPGTSPPNLTIATQSPCDPSASPCAQLIGALGAACSRSIDLVISSVVWNDMHPAFGDSVRATVILKNIGDLPAENFYADYYIASDTLPPAGTAGDQRYFVASLAAGDSLVWVTDYETAAVFEAWLSWFRIDTDMAVLETDEGNNGAGPYAISWRFPEQPGWPALTGYGFHSSPAIVNLDADESNTLETVIGCDDGKVHVLASGGAELPGWPVTIGDTLFSSPAVGDIAGDGHNEVVIGGRDGKVYAFDYLGVKLWEYAAGAPVLTTPALADIDRDTKCEIVFGAGAGLFALEGDGNIYPGSWPVSAGAGSFTSPAVGDVDGDGMLEIAAIAARAPDSFSSRVYLLDAAGTPYSAAWPAAVDTVVAADPVLGNVDDSTSELEIVSGGANGTVYLWKTDGSAWMALPRVPGAIESSPALADLDGDGALEIVVTSRHYVLRDPPGGFVWETAVTAIDDNGSIMAGWPAVMPFSLADRGPSPSTIVIGTRREAVAGSPSMLLSSWLSDGSEPYGFPIDLAGEILTSAAAGDIDNDGTVEIVAAAGDSAYAVSCHELIGGYYTVESLSWPMFRYDCARTACYGFVAPTGIGENSAATPKVTALGSIYPNPFNPATRISFDIARRARVELAVYDIAGRLVSTILSGEMAPGRYEALWNGRTDAGTTAASGVYFCRLAAGRTVETRKLVLVR